MFRLGELFRWHLFLDRDLEAQPPERQTIGNLSMMEVTRVAIFSVLVWVSGKTSVAGEATWTETHTCSEGGGSDDLLPLSWI